MIQAFILGSISCAQILCPSHSIDFCGEGRNLIIIYKRDPL
jgi:hypothetical protein